MKFHAVTLGLAGTLVLGIAASADTHNTTNTNNTNRPLTNAKCQGVPLQGWLPANLIEDIAYHNRKEAAVLAALAPRAQTVGFENIGTVYSFMANEHARSLQDANAWLAQYNLKTPELPESVVAVNAPAPEASIDMLIAEHRKVFDNALELRKCTTNPAARGMLLKTAAETARHLSLLHALDRDVDRGRKTLSASLQGLMASPLTASNYDQWIARFVEEETMIYRTTTTAEAPQTPYVIQEPQVVERIVEKPVYIEKIVEKPVERVVEKIVEKPVYVERIVEKPVYVERVAGQRQTTRPRRPAK